MTTRSKPPISRTRLRNGTTVLVSENHSTPIVSASAYLGGGVRKEPPGKNGISYLTQKLILKGTEHYTAEEIAFKTEAIGSTIVPFTSKDAVGCTISLTTRHLDEGLEIFADCLLHPAFLDQEVEKEREIVLAEIKEERDDLLTYTLDLCDKAIFAPHPYRLPIRGEPETVRQLSRDEIRAWHSLCYRPDNMILAVSGDVQTDRVMKKIEEIFGETPSPSSASVGRPSRALSGEEVNRSSPTGYPFPEQKAVEKPAALSSFPASSAHERKLVEEREKRQLSMAVGFIAPSLSGEDYFPFEALNGVTGGMGSRLFIELRDKKGLAYVVASRYEAAAEYGAFKAYIGTSPEHEEMAREGLLQELARLAEDLIDGEELNRAKRYLTGLYEINRQRNSYVAMRLARYELLGIGYQVAEKYPILLEEVTSSQVREMARKYLRPESSALAIIRPRDSHHSH